MQTHYDYIITGSGCAGLSLLRRMMKHSFFSTKKILLIDKAGKNTNDKTWCFWEQQPGFFEDIVHHRWQQIDFYSTGFSARFDLEPYEYKMVRSIDLYTAVLNEAKQFSNITILHEEVLSIENQEASAIVKTTNFTIYATCIFNSILFENWQQKALQQKNIHVLLQHFKGWLIETKENIFDDRIATFMDFRVSQTRGTTFMYLLPVAKNKALVEYTLFSGEILQQNEYDEALSYYIQQLPGIKNYTITHKEFGIIPMTDFSFSKGEKRIINIGTAGNQTKPGSGYTFQFIQKHAEKIIDTLVQAKDPLQTNAFSEKRFHLYDSILLNVLCNKKMSGDKLFAQLFKKNPPQQVLKFLDNETGLAEELKIMNSVPLLTFLPAALKEIFMQKR